MDSQNSPDATADEASPATVTDRKLLQVPLSSPRKKGNYSKISAGNILKRVSDMSEVEQAPSLPTTSVTEAAKKTQKKTQPSSLSASSSSLPNLDYLSPGAATEAALTMERLDYLNRLRLKLEADLNRSLSEGMTKRVDAGIAGLEFEDMPPLENMTANKIKKVKKSGSKECRADAPSAVKKKTKKDVSTGEQIKKVASEPSLEKLTKKKAGRSLSPKPTAAKKALPENGRRNLSTKEKVAIKKPQGDLLEAELFKEKFALEKLTKPNLSKRRVSPKPNRSKELPENSRRNQVTKEKATKKSHRRQPESDAEFEAESDYEKTLKGSLGRKSSKSKSPRRKTATITKKEEEAKIAAKLRLSELTDIFAVNVEIVDKGHKGEKSQMKSSSERTKSISSRKKSPRRATTPLKPKSSGLTSLGTYANSAPMKCTSEKNKPSSSMVARTKSPRRATATPQLNTATISSDSNTVKGVPLKSPKDPLSGSMRSRISHSRRHREQVLMSASAPGPSVRRCQPDETSISSSVHSTRFHKEAGTLSSSLNSSFSSSLSVSQSRETLARRGRPDALSISSSVHSTRTSLSTSQSSGRVRRRQGRRSGSVTPRSRSSSVQPPLPDLVPPSTEKTKSITRVPLVRATTELSQAEAQEMSQSRRHKGGFNRFSMSPVRARDPRTGMRSSLTSVVSQLTDPLGDDVEKIVGTEAKLLENGEYQTALSGVSSRLSNRAPRSRLSAGDLRERLQMVDTMSPAPSTHSKVVDSDLVSIGVSSHALSVPSHTSKVVVPFAQEIPKEGLKAQRKKANPFSDLDFETGFADLYAGESDTFTAPTSC